MTTVIVDQATPTRLRPRSEGRPARRAGSARGPLARPVLSGSTAPLVAGARGLVGAPSNTVRACRVDAVRHEPARWRLTDRGIALALALGAMIVLAALIVIGLTAWRVTGPEYQAAEVTQLSRR
jgi:hypothetical protein